jgi:hypothetical protein
MDKNRDLLPWILGALSMAIVAMAIAVGSSNRTAPNSTQASSQVTAHALPEAAAIDTATQSTPVLPTTSTVPATPVVPETPAVPATPAAPAPAVLAAQIQPVTPTMVPSGQIWECTTNGQRTFSSHPCGEKSFIREVGPINVMNPTPILPSARIYEPESNYAAEYSYPTQEAVDSSNPMLVGIPYIVRVRPERSHRPYKHDRGAVARRIY